MTEAEVLVRHDQLESFLSKLFQHAGMLPEDAGYHAHALVLSNLWGIDSHGALRAPIYLQRLRSRAINPRPEVKILRGNRGLEVLHGDDGPGFIVGRKAMLRAIELAQQYHIGMVSVVHSNHFGAAGMYAQIAADQGMVGISMTSVGPNIVAPGGSKPIIGNNPIAIAIPTYQGFNFCLDMSLSAVAGGKLLLASKKGEKIPLDWATDKDGRPTDDPDKAFSGFLLPMGGFKGLGLAYMVEILCGVINGGAFGEDILSMYKEPDKPSHTGHVMIAVNIESIIGRDEMAERMAAYIQRVKQSPMWDPQGEMFLPGELEYRKSEQRRREGVPLPVRLYQELLDLALDMGIMDDLTKLEAV
jgi:LDH2 family malate/lactate/ureidoglycolate dehydrogenase